jgi:hypothetical protein
MKQIFGNVIIDIKSSKFADEKKLGECEKRVTELANKIYHKMGY